MNGKDIYKALGEVDDSFIEEAAYGEKTAKIKRGKLIVIGIAACAALLVGCAAVAELIGKWKLEKADPMSKEQLMQEYHYREECAEYEAGKELLKQSIEVPPRSLDPEIEKLIDEKIGSAEDWTMDFESLDEFVSRIGVPILSVPVHKEYYEDSFFAERSENGGYTIVAQWMEDPDHGTEMAKWLDDPSHEAENGPLVSEEEREHWVAFAAAEFDTKGGSLDGFKSTIPLEDIAGRTTRQIEGIGSVDMVFQTWLNDAENSDEKVRHNFVWAWFVKDGVAYRYQISIDFMNEITAQEAFDKVESILLRLK